MWIHRNTLTEAARAGLLPETQVQPLWDFLKSRSSFNFIYLGYFLGALLVIGAFSLFMVTAWEAYEGWALLALSVVYIAGLTVLGWRLWQRPGTGAPGGLLITAAVSIVPLAVYALQNALGLWSGDDPGSYQDFHRWVRGGWIWMEFATLAAGGLALWRVRFPFLAAPLAFVLWYVAMDLTPILYGADFSWDQRRTVSVFFGLALLAGAFWVDRRAREDYAFWLYLFGLMAFWGGLTFMDSDSELGRLGYFLINLLLLAAGVLLKRRVFLVFGGIGVYTYLGHLAWRVFEDFLLFPIALSLLGLGLILAAVKGQKHREAIAAWVERTIPAPMKRWLPPQR